MKTNTLLVTILTCATLFNTGARAHQFPDRPIRIIVGFQPGGAPDVAARILARQLAGALGQPVVVEDRPGANGNIAGDFVAKANPDGYTLLLGNDSMFVVNPHLYRMTFDPLRDLASVASAVSNQFYISVNPSLPVNDFKGFIEYARVADPPLTYGSAGNGSMHHLSMEMLKQRAAIKLLHVPYRSATAAATGVIGGEVQALASGAASAPQIQAGLLRALATTGKTRSPLFPNLPTVAEFYPDYEVSIWLGVFAPAGTPQPVIARLHSALNNAMAMPKVQEQIRALGMEPYVTEPEEFL
jgi:tripartite-type tricarboxylate transporter receptor subunit TctC